MKPASAEGANQLHCADVNRAFSASVWDSVNPGAAPQAQDEWCAFGAGHARSRTE